MNKGDVLIERGADRLEELSRKAAAKGGFAAKLADGLAEDAVFLRKLKPSLIAARARGEASSNSPAAASGNAPAATAPTNEPVEAPTNEPRVAPTNEPAATTMPQPPPAASPPPPPRFGGRRAWKRAQKKRSAGGPNPFLVLGVALATGIVLAKVIDWRGHAHPRD